MKAAFGVVSSVVSGLTPSPWLLVFAVLAMVLAGLATVWLIMSRRYAFSLKTAKSHIELKPADPPDEKKN